MKHRSELGGTCGQVNCNIDNGFESISCFPDKISFPSDSSAYHLGVGHLFRSRSGFSTPSVVKLLFGPNITVILLLIRYVIEMVQSNVGLTIFIETIPANLIENWALLQPPLEPINESK